MRSLPFLLLAGLALVMMAGEADARNPEWNYDSGRGIDSVAVSADGEYIVAGGWEHWQSANVYLFDKDSSTPLWNRGVNGEVRKVAISADGEYIVAASNAGGTCTGCQAVHLFNKNSSGQLWSYGTNHSHVYSLAISADGEYIAAGTADNKIYFFDKDSGTPLWNYTIEDSVLSLAISADGEYIVAGGGYYSKKIYLFSKDSSIPLWNYTTGDWVPAVSISADGEYITAGTGSYDTNVYLFHKDNSTPLWSYETGHRVGSVAISADGEYIAASTSGNEVYLFDKDNSTPLWDYATDGGYVGSVAISADGEYIGVGSYDAKVYFFDKDSSTPLWSYGSFDDDDWGPCTSDAIVAMPADGEYIVVGCGRKVYLFPSNMPPNATIDSITPSSARFDAEVTFSGSAELPYDWLSGSNGTFIAYEWTSDIDGFLSDEEDFSTTGLSPGTHTISFRVQDNDDGDWSEWDTAELYLYPNAQPVATIDSIAPSPAEKGWTVSFSGTGSDSDGTIVGYQWNSSIDGEVSTEKDFSSNSLSPGHHSITFRVQDSDGDWNDANSESLWIYTMPVALAGDDITVNSGDDNVKFRGQGTDEDGNIALYEWDFDGDGIYDWSSPENGRVTQSYNNKGTFTAVLRVTDNDGFTSTDRLVVTISRSGDDDDDGFLPAPSLVASVATVAVIALRRRY